jgi:hypothetical protein
MNTNHDNDSDEDIAILLSILKNTGPYETFFKDSCGNTYVTNGPLTEVQLEYLVRKELERDPTGSIFRDPDHDRKQYLARMAALERGTPWAIDLYPESFSIEAAFRAHGIAIQ